MIEFNETKSVMHLIVMNLLHYKCLKFYIQFYLVVILEKYTIFVKFKILFDHVYGKKSYTCNDSVK